MIEKYCDYLKKKGMHGVMVNGMTGEGMTMTVEERKRLAEEWFKHTRKFQLTMLLNIGGTTFADVIELAEHAEKLGVDGILVLPDLFYKPKIEEDLVWYMKEIFKYAPTRPMLYYHMPMMTKVKCKSQKKSHKFYIHFIMNRSYLQCTCGDSTIWPKKSSQPSVV